MMESADCAKNQTNKALFRIAHSHVGLNVGLRGAAFQLVAFLARCVYLFVEIRGEIIDGNTFRRFLTAFHVDDRQADFAGELFAQKLVRFQMPEIIPANPFDRDDCETVILRQKPGKNVARHGAQLALRRDRRCSIICFHLVRPLLARAQKQSHLQ